jgi:hypothetical protein
MWEHITSHHFHISLSVTIHPPLFMHALSFNTLANFSTEKASKEADGDEVGLTGPTARPPGLPLLFFKFPSSTLHITHLGTHRA